MSEYLKITTPILPRSYIGPEKPSPTSQDVFNLVNLTKITQTNSRNEFTDNNTLNLAMNNEAKSLLINILKNPGLASAALKHLAALASELGVNAEVAVNGDAAVNELLKSLMLTENNVLAEIFSQQQGISAYKGEFFDVLRNILSGTNNQNFRQTVGELLKSITSKVYSKDITDSISENLLQFAELMDFKPEVANVFKQLASYFSDETITGKDANPENFTQLKNSLINVLREINGSIYSTEKTQNLTALIVYNLSKFVNEKDSLSASFEKFLSFIPEEQHDNLRELLNNYLETATQQSESAKLHSQVIEKLSDMITNGLSQKNSATTAEINNLLHSLAAAPTVLTPLLHYIVPMNYANTNAFSEMWVDPDADNQGNASGDDNNVHIFFVSEIDGLGHFEFEIYAKGHEIDFYMFCPDEFVSFFQNFKETVIKSAANTVYTFNNVSIQKFERERSLEQIFDKLKSRRAGIDVKI